MLDVVIPFYKNHSQLEKCKQHIKKSNMSVHFHIHDNSEKNIGFTRAVNEGLLKSLVDPYRYVLVINQDLYLEPQAIQKMIDFMDKEKQFGIVAPIQMNGGEVKSAGGARIYPTGMNIVGPVNLFTNPYIVHWVEAACWLVRKSMIKEIGILDKNMVMFCSDSDYCLRARMANWLIGIVPEAKCEHERGATNPSQNKPMEDQKIHDVTYFRSKWMTGDIYKLLDYEGGRHPVQILGTNLLEK